MGMQDRVLPVLHSDLASIPPYGVRYYILAATNDRNHNSTESRDSIGAQYVAKD